MQPGPFVFIPVSKSRLKAIARGGIEGGVIAFPSLNQARTVRGRVLVVSYKAFKKGEIRPKHIKNCRPYRRAVEITAGGGVLLRESGAGLEVVLIFRKGKWDLPKGKQERGESKKTCAVREVNEELGIDDARILSKLGKTVHGYRARRRRYFLKTTHWYTMVTKAKTFVPQAKEKIMDARWVPIDKAIKILDYEILRDLLSDAKRDGELHL